MIFYINLRWKCHEPISEMWWLVENSKEKNIHQKSKIKDEDKNSNIVNGSGRTVEKWMTNIVGYIVYGKFEETFELLDLQQSQMSVTFSRVNNVSYEKHVDIHAEPAFYCALISQIYLLYLLPVIYCENGDILYLALCHFTIIKYPFQLIFSCPRVKCRPPA